MTIFGHSKCDSGWAVWIPKTSLNSTSQVHQLARVKGHIKNNLKQTNSVGMVVLDIQKAFDSVWHAGLIFKMEEYCFPELYETYKLILNKSYTFSVKVGNMKSIDHGRPAGVPQGAVHLPVLYNLYTSDITSIQNECDLAMFADDTAVYHADRDIDVILTKVQSTLNNLTE